MVKNYFSPVRKSITKNSKFLLFTFAFSFLTTSVFAKPLQKEVYKDGPHLKHISSGTDFIHLEDDVKEVVAKKKASFFFFSLNFFFKGIDDPIFI